MKFTIEREKWLRGEGSKNSYLLRESDKKMCCLGFFCLACQIPEEKILRETTPESLYALVNEVPEEMQFLVQHRCGEDIALSSPICDQLIYVNDDPGLFDKAREVEIARLFSESGVEVEFV